LAGSGGVLRHPRGGGGVPPGRLRIEEQEVDHMFLDVTLYGDGIVEDAYEVLNSWWEEHVEYYGRPHGQTSISRQYGGFGFDTLSPEGGLWLTCGLNYHALQILKEDGVECVRLT